MEKNTKPMTNKEDVATSKDNKIDQDFNGYPHNPSSERTINPKTAEDKAGANLKNKNYDNANQESVGSANAFEATEGGGDVLREELDENKNEKDNQSQY
jgi:hypothetical protein